MLKRVEAIELEVKEEQLSSYTDEHLKTVLEYFADQVDNCIQTTLVSELMTRYAEVSGQLEEKSRQVEKSDAGRREAQEIALLGNWNLDIKTKKIRWSDTMDLILEAGDSRGSDVQMYFERVHPMDRDIAMRILDDFIEGSDLPETRYRLVMEDGRIKWVNIRSKILCDSEGNPVSVHGTIQDITAAKDYEDRMKAYNNHLEEMVREKVEEISASQIATIHALVKLAESRDDDTGEHIARTAEYCGLIARKLWEMGKYEEIIDPAFLDNIAKAGPLHDIGKVGIPDNILLKPGKLTPEEFEIMKTHVTIGYETLASIERRYKMNEFIKIGMDIALYHHEKWDGSGYPHHLKGEEIPISARIMALADVYDALRSRRVYKEGFTHEKSAKIIEEGRGSHFDPLLVDIFLENDREFCEIYERTAAS